MATMTNVLRKSDDDGDQSGSKKRELETIHPGNWRRAISLFVVLTLMSVICVAIQNL
jgi:hypothetical protein